MEIKLMEWVDNYFIDFYDILEFRNVNIVDRKNLNYFFNKF